jgi:hypothetical protein
VRNNPPLKKDNVVKNEEFDRYNMYYGEPEIYNNEYAYALENEYDLENKTERNYYIKQPSIITHCKFGRECRFLKSIGRCRYKHKLSDLPCFSMKSYGKCIKVNCIYSHIIDEPAPLLTSQSVRKRARSPERSYRRDYDDDAPSKRSSDTSSIRDHEVPNTTRLINENFILHFQNDIRELSYAEVIKLLETPIKVITYGDVTMFVVDSKVYENLHELTKIL